MQPNNQPPIPSQPIVPPTGPLGVSPTQNQAPIQGPAPKQAPRNPNTTQNSLQISELRDGIAIMNDGSFRAVIACQSINFDLMSAREREGVEFSYQNFLNSLYFQIQIFIRSQRVDIGPYIDRLVDIRKNQDNMLLNVLMDDYINFIDVLSQEANIMDKSFFIVIPYFSGIEGGNLVEVSKGFFGKLFAKQNNSVTRIDQATYAKAKDEIKNRVDAVTSGLFQVGVKSVQLTTKELGELYYNVYNPDTAVREPLGDFENITTTFIKKGEGPTPAVTPGGVL